MIRPPTICHTGFKHTLITIDGETFCNSCGVVLETIQYESTVLVSKTNLAQDYQLGSKPTNQCKIEKHINPYTELSQISNVHESLDLPAYVREDAWKWFQKLSPLLDMTYPKIVFLTVYVFCRYYGIPIKEKELSEFVQICLHKKNPMSALKVISKAMSFYDTDGECILEKVGFTKYMKHDKRFLLFSLIQQLGRKHPSKTVDNVRTVCFSMMENIDHQDPQTIRRVFKLAKKRCSIC